MRKEIKTFDIICGGCGKTVRIQTDKDPTTRGPEGLPPGWSWKHKEISYGSTGWELYPKRDDPLPAHKGIHRDVGGPQEKPPPGDPREELLEELREVVVVWQDLCETCTAAFSLTVDDRGGETPGTKAKKEGR